MDEPFAMGQTTESYSGWHSMQLMLMLECVDPTCDKQDFTNKYMSALRPPIAGRMVKDADEVFTPEVAQLVKQFKEEWQDGTE